MKVNELMAKLVQLNPLIEIYLSSDEEGNHIKPIADVKFDKVKFDGDNTPKVVPVIMPYG